MRSKAYDLAILNVTRQIKSNNHKTMYGLFGLMARVLAEVGLEVSSDAVRKQVKKNRRKIISRSKSMREDTAPSKREDTAPDQEICADQ